MKDQDSLFIILLLLLVLIPATPFLFTQPTHQEQPQTQNTVGNAAGTTALLVTGGALLTTLSLAQQAEGAVQSANQLKRHALQPQTIHAIKNTTTHAEGLRIVLTNTLSQPIDVSQISVTITSDTRDHKALYADICTNTTEDIACILPPRQDETLMLQRGERIELYLNTPIERSTDVQVDIRTADSETEITTTTPNVFRSTYTRLI